MENNYTYLKLIQSQNLTFWDVKSYNQQDVSSQYKVEKLQNLLIEHTKKVKLFEKPEDDFKILGVNNQEGLFDAYIEKGKNINQPYKKVENGYFAYNPYRINVGSIGLKSDKQKYDYISPAYVVFSCQENLYPQYLEILLKTSYFAQAIRHNTTGSVRQTLGFDNLCNISIPLPSVEKQKELVSEYEHLQNFATQKEEDAKKIENSIDDYLLSELGIEHIDMSNDKKTLFRLVNYMDLNKWIIPDNIEQFTSSKYNFVTFGNIVKEGPSYGANVKGCSIDNGCRYIRITDINDDGSLNNDIAYPERIDNRYLLKENDFLIARSGATVGKTFLYKDKFGKCIYAGYLVRYRLKDCIVPEFLFYYTHSSVYKLWVVKNQRVAAQPNINGQEYLNFPLIVPSLKTQEAIIKEIDNKKEKIQKLRNESEQFKQQAISNFEQEVFN